MNIITKAALVTGYTEEEIKGKSRERHLVMVRHCLMWYLRTKERMTLKHIARIFNKNDHSTVIHGCTMVDNYLQTQDEMYLPIHHAILSQGHRDNVNNFYTSEGITVRVIIVINLPIQ